MLKILLKIFPGMTYKEVFASRQGLIVKQTFRGCCCSVRNEFSQHEFIDGIAQADDAGPEVLFTKERAGCLWRCLSDSAVGFRPTSFDTWCTDGKALSTCEDSERPGLDKVGGLCVAAKKLLLRIVPAASYVHRDE